MSTFGPNWRRQAMRKIKRDERLQKTETPEQTAARHHREFEEMWAKKKLERQRAAEERRELERRAARAGESDGRLLRIDEVLKLTGLRSRTTVWKLERARQFPSRVKLTGRIVGWRGADVARWVAERKTARST